PRFDQCQHIHVSENGLTATLSCFTRLVEVDLTTGDRNEVSIGNTLTNEYVFFGDPNELYSVVNGALRLLDRASGRTRSSRRLLPSIFFVLAYDSEREIFYVTYQSALLAIDKQSLEIATVWR
ncbi:MAG: hypothetical protein AAFY60_16590, partial [Myxococcota bacterium]